jgi:hypothetical protein
VSRLPLIKRPRGVAAFSITRTALRAPAALAVVSITLLAPPALAAEAPVRTIARDLAGNATTAFGPTAVSSDGREVIGNVDGYAVVRDVEAGTTRKLVDASAVALSASTDLKVVLLSTYEGLIPSDTDRGPDLYVLDRATNAVARATDVPQTFQNGTFAQFGGLRDSTLSGNGQVVYFRLSLRGPNTDAAGQSIWSSEDSLWRFDRTTGKTVKLRDMPVVNGSSFEIAHTDQAGTVAITNEGAQIGSRTVPLPGLGDDLANRSARIAISSDGRAIAVSVDADRTTIKIVSTATGAVSTIPMPTWLVDAGYQLLNASTVGVLVAGRFNRSTGLRDAIGFVNTRGSVTQVGGDIATFSAIGTPIVSENLGFAASGQFLAQLGSRPIPGTEPAPASLPISTWVSHGDATCAEGFLGRTWTRAWVALSGNARATDPRVPASASVRVFSTATPSKVYNAFTLAAGKSRELTVPRTGGWSYSITVTFTDGTKTSGTVDIPVHGIACSPLVL